MRRLVIVGCLAVFGFLLWHFFGPTGGSENKPPAATTPDTSKKEPLATQPPMQTADTSLPISYGWKDVEVPSAGANKDQWSEKIPISDVIEHPEWVSKYRMDVGAYDNTAMVAYETSSGKRGDDYFHNTGSVLSYEPGAWIRFRCDGFNTWICRGYVLRTLSTEVTGPQAKYMQDHPHPPKK